MQRAIRQLSAFTGFEEVNWGIKNNKDKTQELGLEPGGQPGEYLETISPEQLNPELVRKLPLEFLKNQCAIPVILADSQVAIALAENVATMTQQVLPIDSHYSETIVEVKLESLSLNRLVDFLRKIESSHVTARTKFPQFEILCSKFGIPIFWAVDFYFDVVVGYGYCITRRLNAGRII